MANGAIGAFQGDPDDGASLKQEEANKDTIRRYYARVWTGRDIDAIDDLVSENFVIYRDGQVRRGKAALKALATQTIANFQELRVEIEEMVGLRDKVAVRLDVWHKRLDGNWERFKGVDITSFDGGLIAETAVSYREPEIITPSDSLQLLPP